MSFRSPISRSAPLRSAALRSTAVRSARLRSAALRHAALIVLPVLALGTACGGGGDDKDANIASAPQPRPTANDKAGDPAPGGPTPPPNGQPRQQGGGKSAFYDAQLVFTQCMRREGLKDWPDPKLSGFQDWTKIERIQAAENDRDAQARLGAAMNACKEPMQQAMQLEPKLDQQQIYESLLAHAQCMRSNGVSKFANPKMQGGIAQPGGEPNPISPQIDSKSPAYKQAEATCKPKLVDGADGMQ